MVCNNACLLLWRALVEMWMLSCEQAVMCMQVRNIVHGSERALQQLYAGHLQSPTANAAGLRQTQPEQWQQCGGIASRAELISGLPMVCACRSSGLWPSRMTWVMDPCPG